MGVDNSNNKRWAFIECLLCTTTLKCFTYILPHAILTTALWDLYHYHAHFTDEETEAQGYVKCSVASVVSNSATPRTGVCQAPLSMGFPRQECWSRLPFPPSGDFLNPGIKSRFPALQVDSLLSEPLGKSMNTGVGSLSLLQGIFPTQESNWGLLNCGQILYQLI